ncbi:hypothetical protein [Heliophilum fasciatum]|uniref:Uncharacterized protein n=1 Tax=Heliophilum fasciatum TaxID=35700 RepID=A0A4R2RLI0_9FIRM|nr:hypothetical protein [Heliophilum fasciatum]MCW2277713.1 hypothetical protein [Heliophilum fasciatum]TCP64792.1 hypothetical protein EDD73_108145 [Heliophilum fasciatum]
MANVYRDSFGVLHVTDCKPGDAAATIVVETDFPHAGGYPQVKNAAGELVAVVDYGNGEVYVGNRKAGRQATAAEVAQLALLYKALGE